MLLKGSAGMPTRSVFPQRVHVEVWRCGGSVELLRILDPNRPVMIDYVIKCENGEQGLRVTRALAPDPISYFFNCQPLRVWFSVPSNI